MAAGTLSYGARPLEPELHRPWFGRVWRWARATLVSAALCSALGLVSQAYLQRADLVVMIYLLGALGVAHRLPIGGALLAALLHGIVFDYLFIPPRFAFAWPDSAITLAAMIVLSGALASSYSRIRTQERLALFRARAASTMYQLSHELGRATSFDQVAAVSSRNVERMLGCRAWVVAADADHAPEPTGGALARHADAIRQAWSRLEPAVERSSSALESVSLPLLATRHAVGVLVVEALSELPISATELVMLLEQCAQQAAAAIEKVTLEQETRRAELACEAERLRNSLLSAVSHDVRTPLSAIRAAGELLVSQSPGRTSAQDRELAGVVVRESDRMLRLVENILSLTRVESGTLVLRQQDVAVEDLVESALRQVAVESTEHPIQVRLAENLPFASVDPMLMGQVLVNLLDNACKYSAPHSCIELLAESADGFIEVLVQDEGPGFQPQESTRLFEKFVRGAAAASSTGGLGLGLSICRAILAAHGGTIRLANRSGRAGALVSIRIPQGRAADLAEEAPLAT